MVKILIRVTLLSVIGLTLLISSLSAFKPTELYRDQVAVLMYHHVHDTATSSSTITTKLFRDQLAELNERGYNFISLDEFKQYMKGGKVPDNAVLVTFDDGYESFYDNAYPVLKEMNIPAVNFLITETLDDPLGGNIPFITRDEVRTIAKDSSLVEFGCHTNAMHSKTDNGNGQALLVARLNKDGRTETEEEYKARILADTNACNKNILELTGKPNSALAYPYGIYNRQASDILHEAGIDYAFTVMPRMVTRDTGQFKIPRINAGSPYVTPEGLHSSIIRRVTAVDMTKKNYVPLRDTVEQIGGDMTKDDAGNLTVRYNGEKWIMRLNSREVTHNGETLTMEEPISAFKRRAHISVNDLNKLLGVDIKREAPTGIYTAGLPDSSGKDAETPHSRK